MKKILNIASLFISAKALWWDKLPQAEKDRYIGQATRFVSTHKDTALEKGKSMLAARKEKSKRHPVPSNSTRDHEVDSQS